MIELLGPPSITYCEPAVNGFVKRPWYALSNLAFFIAAIIIYRKERSKLARQFTLLAVMIGVLSLVYDVSYLRITQLADLSGMLLFVSFLLFLNFKQLFPSRDTTAGLFIIGILSILSIIVFGGYTGNILFGAYILAVIATEVVLLRRKNHTNSHLWWFALGIFALGFGMWLLDASKTICFDFGLLNGRAIFHYTSSIVIYMMFNFYRQQIVPGKNL